MNVALVIGGLAGGGAERQLAMLASGLVQRGHSVRVLLLSKTGSSDYVVAPQVDVISLRLNRFTGLLSGWNRLRRELEAADVVYSFLDLANALCALGLPRAGSTKLVWGWRASNLSPGLIPRLAMRMSGWLARIPNAAIANSDAVLEFYQATLPNLPSDLPLQVIANGVSVAELNQDRVQLLRQQWRSAQRIPEHAFVVLCLSRVSPEKRQDVLVAAVAQAQDLYLVLAGRGVATTWQRWVPAAADVSQRIRAFDLLEDVQPLFAAADLLVQPSMSEGLPNSVLEAMARRVPVVASQVGGLSELLGATQERGLLVATNDAAAWSSAIQAVRDDRALAQTKARAAYAYVQQEYGVDAMLDKTERVLLEQCDHENH